jgi:hypothetical protein
LMGKYEKLVEERKQLENIFVTKTQAQHKKESIVINNFKQWMSEREKSMDDHSIGSTNCHNLEEEEKKVEDVIDFVERTMENPSKIAPRPPSMASPRPSSIATSAAIIDLSNLASPRDDRDDP